jgi:hypothetical protein
LWSSKANLSALHVEEIVLSAKRFEAGLTSLREVEMWKKGKSPDNRGRQERMVNA